jgi:hypothetical protein
MGQRRTSEQRLQAGERHLAVACLGKRPGVPVGERRNAPHPEPLPDRRLGRAECPDRKEIRSALGHRANELHSGNAREINAEMDAEPTLTPRTHVGTISSAMPMAVGQTKPTTQKFVSAAMGIFIPGIQDEIFFSFKVRR